MKKLFALVLALVMALSLVACGDKKDDSGDVTAEHTDTTTVAVGAVILARDDVSSDDVYKFVADIFDNAASLTTSHAKYGELSLEYGASITSVPYHPGAAKYFSEKGFEVASVKDGAGKSVSIGAPGSGVYFNAIDVLGAYGLTEDDIKPTYQSFGDSADALKNGQIDAAFIVAGAPTTAVTDLATTKDTYLVSLDSEHIAKLLETSDYYTETVIAKDVYFGD